MSNTSKSAIEPSIVAGSAGQFVAWADNRGGTYQIYVAEHTAGGWIELGNSAHGGGISNTAGDSRRPSITVDGSGNPIVAWTVFNGSSSDIEAATYNAVSHAWVALGSSLSAGGISATGTADNARIVQNPAGPVVAWLDRHGSASNIYARTCSTARPGLPSPQKWWHRDWASVDRRRQSMNSPLRPMEQMSPSPGRKASQRRRRFTCCNTAAACGAR